MAMKKNKKKIVSNKISIEYPSLFGDKEKMIAISWPNEIMLHKEICISLI